MWPMNSPAMIDWGKVRNRGCMISAYKLKKILCNILLTLMVVALVPASISGQSLASSSIAEAVARFAPEGWQIVGKVKQFTPQTLYEQINGRASFFLAYDMLRLTFVSFGNDDGTAKFLNLSIYDMGTPTNAFGVFSGERSPGESPVSLGRAGYRSDANYFLWQGRYYIRIISSGTTGDFKRLGLELARRVTAFLPDSGAQVWGLAALPLKDRVPQSVQFFKADAMGLDFMRNTYMAQYRKGRTQVTAFLTRRDSAQSARDTVVRYTRFAEKYGRGIEHLKVGAAELVACDMGGGFDVVFHKSHMVGGVSDVEGRALAIRAATELWQQLN